MLDIPYTNIFDTEDSVPDIMSRVSCVLIAPKYEYLGEDETEAKVHAYLTKVNFLPTPLHKAFFDEVDRFALDFLHAKSTVSCVYSPALHVDMVNSIRKAVDTKPEVLFILFVGYGTAEKGMVLQDHCSMTQADLHRIILRTLFSGTLIEVFCMCFARGVSYSPVVDGDLQLSSIEKRPTSRFSIHSSTFYSQKMSVGLAFLRKLRCILFENGRPQYTDVTPDALHATREDISKARIDMGKKDIDDNDDDSWEMEENDMRLKKNQTPLVEFCGRCVMNKDVIEALAGIDFFSVLPALP